jgi:hypothetical protein
VSLIQRCPHFRVQFALRTAVWDQIRCPYFTGCPHFAGLLFTGFTVQIIRSKKIFWEKNTNQKRKQKLSLRVGKRYLRDEMWLFKVSNNYWKYYSAIGIERVNIIWTLFVDWPWPFCVITKYTYFQVIIVISVYFTLSLAMTFLYRSTYFVYMCYLFFICLFTYFLFPIISFITVCLIKIVTYMAQ